LDDIVVDGMHGGTEAAGIGGNESEYGELAELDDIAKVVGPGVANVVEDYGGP
jgi:hypothetical protein